MKITEIRRQKRNHDRVSVFLDGEFWTGMSESLFLDLKIHQNQEINRDEKNNIEDKVIEDGALSYAISALSRKQFSEKKLKERLEKREYGPDVIEKVIARCVDLGLLDDKALALMVSESRKNSGQYEKKIDLRLKEIGIEKSLRDEVLREVFLNEDEFLLAEKSLAESRFKNKKLDLKDQQRALGFLTRNGFSFKAARVAVEKVALTPEEEIEKNGVGKALSDLSGKYKESDVKKDGFYQKAVGFLSRRGYHQTVAREAVMNFKDSFGL